jgi:glycosyltransferase involved in cell wall biosynthesis
MKVAIISESPCYPPTAGNRIRTLNLMLPLAGRHDITFICRSTGDAKESRQAREYLADQGITPVIVDDPPPRRSGLRFYARLAANLMSPVPYSVAAHNSRLVRETVRRHATENNVDLWQFEWLAYADALLPHPQFRKILVAHDVVSLLWQRHYQTTTNPLKRWYIRRQCRKFERYEGKAMREASCVVTVSAEDAAVARKLYGVHSVQVVENGVDNRSFADVAGTRDPRCLLYVGALETRPNLDAVALLLDRILPQVRAQVPEARLLVVGRNPPTWLQQRIERLEGVELHANVPDVRPFLARSGVLAVPLRIAGGSRLKILEALSTGLPVVSTRVGAEGLELTPGRDLTVVESVDEMAAVLIAGLHHPESMQALARHGQRIVRERYDWHRLADKLECVWERTAATCGREAPASLSV